MKEQKLIILAAMICAIVSIQAGWWSASAQENQPKPPKPPADVLIERDVLIVAPPAPPAPAGAPQPVAPEIVMAKPGDDFTFSFISSEMSFDSNPVKNAPYSAEAVTEVTQVLSDGNRIVRKTMAAVHRDGAGRTRRDQTLGAIGPFATAGDAPQTILINDSVAGVNYILDPRTRTARKLILPPLRFGPVGAVAAPLPPAAPDAPVMVAAVPGIPNIMAVKVRPLSPKNAVKKVEPVYPPAAKAAGAQGLVKVQVIANEAGEVVSASAVEGHSLLQPAAVEAVRQWRFKPLATIGNHPMKVKSIVSFNFVLPAGSNAVTVVEEGNLSPAALPSESVNEPLGKQTIEGVEAEGTRTTFTIPENAIGNERPIKITNERWYAPELQVVVMTKRNDPRFGETTYRLTNINRSEPPASLFEVPADYTLKEGPERFRTIKKIRE